MKTIWHLNVERPATNKYWQEDKHGIEQWTGNEDEKSLNKYRINQMEEV